MTPQCSSGVCGVLWGPGKPLAEIRQRLEKIFSSPYVGQWVVRSSPRGREGGRRGRSSGIGEMWSSLICRTTSTSSCSRCSRCAGIVAIFGGSFKAPSNQLSKLRWYSSWTLRTRPRTMHVHFRRPPPFLRNRPREGSLLPLRWSCDMDVVDLTGDEAPVAWEPLRIGASQVGACVGVHPWAEVDELLVAATAAAASSAAAAAND